MVENLLLVKKAQYFRDWLRLWALAVSSSQVVNFFSFRIKQTDPNVTTITDIGISLITEVAYSRLELSCLYRQIKCHGLTAYMWPRNGYFCALIWSQVSFLSCSAK